MSNTFSEDMLGTVNADSDHAIGILLWSTTQVVQRAFDRLLADAGISRPIWLILLALQEDPPPITQREVADRVELREATLTHHLHAMEEAGLVVRVRGTENRRTVRVDLTEHGRAVIQRVYSSAMSFNDELRGALGDDAVATLRGLRTLRDRFADGERIPPPL